MEIQTAKKLIIILIVLLTILTGVLTFNLIKETRMTGESIKDYYTYTKAMCDENNYCQDYEIVCENYSFKEMKPISGAVIQNPSDWKDPRDEETIKRLCD